jgi:hypothetical protein
LTDPITAKSSLTKPIAANQIIRAASQLRIKYGRTTWWRCNNAIATGANGGVVRPVAHTAHINLFHAKWFAAAIGTCVFSIANTTLIELCFTIRNPEAINTRTVISSANAARIKNLAAKQSGYIITANTC